MNPQPFVIFPKDYPQPLQVVGEQVSVLASGAETHGYEVFVQEGAEGSGPPPHHHPWDETFYVLRGQIEFGMADQQVTGVPGTLVHVPAGTTHWFRFATGGGNMITLTSRLGASKLFADIDREISPAQPDKQKLLAIAARHGLTVAV